MSEAEYQALLEKYENLNKEYMELASRKEPKVFGLTAPMLQSVLWFLALLAALALCPNSEEISALFQSIGDLIP